MEHSLTWKSEREVKRVIDQFDILVELSHIEVYLFGKLGRESTLTRDLFLLLLYASTVVSLQLQNSTC